MILRTACGMSADRSMKAGVFPGPTPIAGVPELYAARTIPDPPVARISATSFECISSSVPSRVTIVMQPKIPSGPPAAQTASESTRIVSRMHPFALGCGEKTMPFPAFSATIAL